MELQKHDVFICHASEDKELVARPFALKLKSLGVDVWFDEFSLKWGDSLMQSINRGLRDSLFGIVVLSPNFFGKKWTEMELQALIELTQPNEKKILPLRYNLSHEELKKQTPLISGIISRSWDDGIEKLSDEILEILNKKKKIEDVYKSVFKNVELVDPIFRNKFENIIDQILNYTNPLDSRINDVIDIAIMLVKERIEKWDVPSVKYAMERLFKSLYQQSEKNGLNELHPIFRDLFSYAYNQRKHVVGTMIQILNLILFQAWVENYDVEKAEKGSKLLLRLGMDFVNKDLGITKDCATAIDNIAGDMFESEIFSKEILLASYLFELQPNNVENKNLVDELLRWIKFNDQYSWDAEMKDYLKKATEHAESEKSDYGIEFTKFKQRYLYPIIKKHMLEQINGFVQFLMEDSIVEGNLEYEKNDLRTTIRSYKFLNRNISEDIKQKVLNLRENKAQEKFNAIVKSDKYLKKIFGI